MQPPLTEQNVVDRFETSGACSTVPVSWSLVRLGEQAFPIYEKMLANAQLDSFNVARLFAVIGAVQADRRRFVDPAVRGLCHPDYYVRLEAVKLLAEIGTRDDASPIVALLSDQHPWVAHAAATTLAKIGGPREYRAMRLWEFQGTIRHLYLREHLHRCLIALEKKIEDRKKVS
jgi:hypothetical protein